jgi:hypothetical protein
MLILAIANGSLRDLVYKKYVGELAAHQISTVSLLILFAFYIGFLLKKFPPISGGQAIWIGLFWLTLTLVFEFGFGRLSGNSWEILLEDYDILKGRIWILIPVWIVVAPYFFYKIRG